MISAQDGGTEELTGKTTLAASPVSKIRTVFRQALSQRQVADATATCLDRRAINYLIAASSVAWIQIATSAGATLLPPTRNVASAAAGALVAALP